MAWQTHSATTGAGGRSRSRSSGGATTTGRGGRRSGGRCGWAREGAKFRARVVSDAATNFKPVGIGEQKFNQTSQYLRWRCMQA